MATAIILPFDQLRHGAHFFVLVVSHDRQVIAQNTGKLGKDPVLDVSILQHIGDEGRNQHGILQIPPVQLHIVPEVSLIGNVPGSLQLRWCRIPFVFLQEVQIRLLRQKIGIQHVAQLMCEKAGHHLIAIHAAPYLGDTGVARIDYDAGVVGTGGISVVRIPVDVDMHSAVVTVTLGLSSCHIFKVTCKNPGGEELLICDLAPMFIQ